MPFSTTIESMVVGKTCAMNTSRFSEAASEKGDKGSSLGGKVNN